MLENTDDKLKTDTTKTKQNPEKANNAKHSKTKLAWISRLFTTLGQNYYPPSKTPLTIFIYTTFQIN